jgi:hypothetical protein
MKDDPDYTINTNLTDLGNITLDITNSKEYTYTTSGYNGSSSIWNTYTNTSTVEIDTNGITMADSADINIGGRSMKEFMDSVEKRLGILHPNKKLESEWEELKELGERYRELEKEILERTRVWDILKK